VGKVDDEDCWGINCTELTAQMKAKIETILYTWGKEQPEVEQDEVTKLIPERERFSVPHASRDPRIFKDMNLKNENIFELDNRPHSGNDHARHSHDSTTIRTSKHGRSTMASCETHLNKH